MHAFNTPSATRLVANAAQQQINAAELTATDKLEAVEPENQEEGSLKNDRAEQEKAVPEQAPKKEPQPIRPYRLKLGRNQKQRSKLSQLPEEVSTPAPAPAPPAPEPAKSEPPPQPGRRTRMKRSGHMHEDLTAPLDEGPRREDQY